MNLAVDPHRSDDRNDLTGDLFFLVDGDVTENPHALAGRTAPRSLIARARAWPRIGFGPECEEAAPLVGRQVRQSDDEIGAVPDPAGAGSSGGGA